MFDIERLITSLNLKKKEFAMLVDVKASAISNAIRRNSLPIEWRSKINSQYPDVNYDEFVIELSTFKTKSNSFKQVNDIIVIDVPVIPIKAYAQYIDEFYNEARDITFERTLLEVDHYGKGTYLSFDVSGDSMNGGLIDDTPDGARVLAREIGQHLWRGGLYKSKYGHIIITNKNILFKDIVECDLDSMKVTLHSRNESPEYTDFTMPLGYREDLDHILQIFKVQKRYNM